MELTHATTTNSEKMCNFTRDRHHVLDLLVGVFITLDTSHRKPIGLPWIPSNLFLNFAKRVKRFYYDH